MEKDDLISKLKEDNKVLHSLAFKTIARNRVLELFHTQKMNLKTGC